MAAWTSKTKQGWQTLRGRQRGARVTCLTRWGLGACSRLASPENDHCLPPPRTRPLHSTRPGPRGRSRHLDAPILPHSQLAQRLPHRLCTGTCPTLLRSPSALLCSTRSATPASAVSSFPLLDVPPFRTLPRLRCSRSIRQLPHSAKTRLQHVVQVCKFARYARRMCRVDCSRAWAVSVSAHAHTTQSLRLPALVGYSDDSQDALL